MDAKPASERYSSRKFWTMVLAETMWVVMRYDEVLPVEAFVQLTYLTVGGYFLVNGAQHILEKK
jgi:hypothetical protein